MLLLFIGVAVCVTDCSSASPWIGTGVQGHESFIRNVGTTEYVDIFMRGGPWPVAMTPGPNGELWFSACYEGARGPCEIGYYTRALHQVIVAKKIPFVSSLVYGPDKNVWFTSGTGPNRGIIGPNP